MSRNRPMTARFALLVVIVLVAGCSAGAAASPTGVPAVTGYDRTAAAEQARTFATIATSNPYGNYGEQFTRFCEVNFGFDCNREGRDVSPGLSSGEEIQKWDSEKNNPQSVVADIGILFIPQAEQVGILANYQPPNANLLPEDLRGDGWVATFTGVPTFLVNTDALELLSLPVPETWEALADPAYERLVGLGRVGVSGSGTWAFVAMNLAAGGTLENWQPGVDYGKRLLSNLVDQATLETFERGEVPIAIRYDFNNATWFEDLEDDGVTYRLIVPSDGSVFAPSTLMMNRYDVAHQDFGKMFMEWVLTDEAQVIFARYGARPIRSVVGNNRLTIPQEAKENWLPSEDYTPVQTVDWRSIDSDEVRDIWESQVAGGG